ncbi:MAG: lanthionine synthetase C family protein [Micropruina sp.]|uniref:lanthionine synthetase C family protein n=1 Tax=Micropruina sp. TaxID=2737536 RepID=UPI0039E57C55
MRDGPEPDAGESGAAMAAAPVRTHRLIQHYPIRPRPASSWHSPLPDDLAERASAAALLLAERCTDPARVTQANRLCVQQTRFPTALHWDPTSIAQGDLGQALLCAELDRHRPGQGWDVRAATLASTTATLLGRGHRPAMGSVGGSSGMAFAGRRIGAVALNPLLPGLDGVIAQDALATAAAIRGRRGLSVGSFDQISGLAGVALCALPNPEQSARPVVPFVLRALAALALEGGQPPAWYSPAELLYDDEQRSYYPFGNVNLGLAHGIPGPLAALAIAVLCGVGSDDCRAAAESLAEWLAAHVSMGDDGPGWDTVVALAQGPQGLVEVPAHRVGRDAWCYGTPGAARALFLAGRALDRSDLRNLAIEAMAAVYRRPPAVRGIDSPTFCHGVSGLLQITLRFHHDTGLPLFAEAASALTEQILDAVEPDRPMGIACVEPGDNKVDQPGVLDGAAGVSLVLLSAGSEVEPTWDRMFALS